MVVRSWECDDFDILANILYETWFTFRMTASYEVGLQKAKIYLQQCLEISTFRQVIEINHQPVGFLLANSRMDSVLENNKQQINYDACDPFPSKLKKQYKKSNTRYKKHCMSLLHDVNKSFDGEITLFVIKPEFKGKGFGKLLFHKVVEYLYTIGCHSFFLFSDSSCDYSFYDYIGMKCLSSKSLHPNKLKKGFEIYLYEGNIPFMKSSILNKTKEVLYESRWN